MLETVIISLTFISNITLYLKDTGSGDCAKVVAGFTGVAASIFLRGVADGEGGDVVVIVHHAVTLVLHQLSLLLQPERGQGHSHDGNSKDVIKKVQTVLLLDKKTLRYNYKINSESDSWNYVHFQTRILYKTFYSK